MCVHADRARLRKACVRLGGPCLSEIYCKFHVLSRIPKRERERESRCDFVRVAHLKLREVRLLLYANLEPILFDRMSVFRENGPFS